MTASRLSNPKADTFLQAVRRELADVRWRQRDDLLATVRERLAELPAHVVPGRELGPPSDYARELRDSAGLPPRRHGPFVRFRAARPRTMIATIAVIVTIPLVGTALAERAHYQPLWAEAFEGGTNARRISDDLVSDTDYYQFQSGKYIWSGIELHNDGLVPVTVDGISFASETSGPLVLRELRATSNELLGGQFTRAPKVERVTVQPDKTVILFVVMKMQLKGTTITPGNSEVFDQPKLRIRVLGVHHLVSVDGNKIGVLHR